MTSSNQGDTNMADGQAIAEAEQIGSSLSILFGFLGIVAISLLPLLALAMRPISSKPIYKHILLFLMSLGVGVLVASSFLFLLPTAIGLEVDKEEDRIGYIFKMTVYYATFVFFFNFEIFFRQIINFYTKKKKASADERSKGSSSRPPLQSQTSLTRTSSAILNEAASVFGSEEHMHGEGSSVIWVILTGDGIHSFVDGVAVGSAIVSSLAMGLTMVLVIFVEELPHKLGDVAVLLYNGIPNCRAILYCWLATLPCYIGYFIGVLVGNVLESATPWIYSIAAALFVYTGLVDILPEVLEQVGQGKTNMTSLFKLPNEHCERASLCSSVNGKYLVRIGLTNFGLIAGFMVTALMAFGENHITFS